MSLIETAPARTADASARSRLLPRVCVLIVVAGLALSAWAPYDRMAWLLEVVWVLVGLPLVVLAWRRFPLTGLLCLLLTAHALVVPAQLARRVSA
ncbi:hypothetical protein V1460_18620 [Streptomyces sp. SCSIO 30461]|uniref:hypothetical protein n=1 Tax=Streptomyces sp. SCSIO 30461 TaxID=3118085 RepID=UPI0030CE4B8A